MSRRMARTFSPETSPESTELTSAARSRWRRSSTGRGGSPTPAPSPAGGGEALPRAAGVTRASGLVLSEAAAARLPATERFAAAAGRLVPAPLGRPACVAVASHGTGHRTMPYRYVAMAADRA